MSNGGIESSSDLILLDEYVSTICELDHVDCDYLRRETPTGFTVRETAEPGVYELNPAQFVGVVNLPSGRMIRCRPKVPVANLFYMLATAVTPGISWPPVPPGLAEIDDLFDFFVDWFVDLTDELLERGLYRSYVERSENLLTVRGRIDIAQDVRQNHIMRHRTWCRYEEFTWDIPENRVLRQAVFAASGMVQKSELRRRLSLLDAQLGELDPAPLPLSTFDTFTYHRLNETYEPVHVLAHLILRGFSVSEHFGDVDFRSFLIDMNRLFEDFITISLQQRCDAGIRLEGQYNSRLDVESRVTIKPDLAYLIGKEVIGVADCKYKRIKDETFQHHDLYQMLAYCTALDLPRGGLIYPQGEWPFADTSITVRYSLVEIRHFSVDLSVSMKELQFEMDRLANELLAWALLRPAIAA